MIFLPEINSTNDFVRQLSAECSLPSGFAVRSDFQSSGHGQATNTWESERGMNLLLSILVRPQSITLSNQFALSQIVSIAIVEAIQKLTTERVEIKWPNDIYVGNKKICGILIENSILGNTWAHSIVGIGLNVNQTSFFSDAPNPVSLKQITNCEFNVESIAKDIIGTINEMVEYYSPDCQDSLKDLYFSRLYQKSGSHEYEICSTRERIFAEIIDVRPMGHLILHSSQGEHAFAFKEVKFL